MRSATELLRLARTLAADGSGRPAWIARNRAVSTGYYALFHAPAEFCGRQLIGAWRPWPAFRHTYRSLEHSQARRVLDGARRDPGSSQALKDLGEVFTDLQEKRHAADYDPGYRITNAALRALLTDAEQAVSRLGELPPRERKLLAARLIGRTRG